MAKKTSRKTVKVKFTGWYKNGNIDDRTFKKGDIVEDLTPSQVRHIKRDDPGIIVVYIDPPKEDKVDETES